MSVRAVLFDLDGTLLPMDLDVFVKYYFQRLSIFLEQHVAQPQQVALAIRDGIHAMMANRGEKRNEAVFWEAAYAACGDRILEARPYLDAFYETEFDTLQEICGFAPEAAQVVHRLQEKGLRVILATNPIFPAIAVRSRIRWAGLQPEDFELYTTYEDYNFSKPREGYYRQILARLDLQPEDCLMVGNDVGDDMVTETFGMQVFLLTEYLINKENVDISRYPHGGYGDLLQFIEKL